jgi:Tfp pilus assembly protein FimT
MSEWTVYPGTLTYPGAVPTIGLARQRVGTVIGKRSRDGFWMPVTRLTFEEIVSGSGGPRKWQMRMKSLKANRLRRRDRESGFSLLEMVTVLAISIIVSVVSVMSLIPMMKQQRITNAYNTTLSALRLARDNAIAQRTSYSVTFANGAPSSTITVTPTLSTFQGAQNTTVYNLPMDMSFKAQTGYPAVGPDGYGTGITAIDFGYTANGGSGGQTTFYFCPDGSAQDAEGGAGNCSGSWDGGVVYLARSGELMSSRAITLWGGTGRIRGWRLYSNGSGGYQWLRQ